MFVEWFGVRIKSKNPKFTLSKRNFWDKEIGNYRTTDENYALNIIHNISISYENKKEGELENSPSKVNSCG